MKVLVTGAGGFLGRAVAAAAARAGHDVIAMVRPASAGRDDGAVGGIRQVAGDLRQRGAWRDAVTDVDAVVHCAAAFGDLASQLAGTVLATENLLGAIPATARIVHVSSLSVYDFDAPRFSGTLDENTPLEREPLRRDAYTQTKLLQERLVREHAARTGCDLVVVRPGAIYGPGKDWEFGRAIGAGRFDLVFAPSARMRLVHVDNCADAIVAALTVPLDAPLTVNLIDGEQPSHWRYHALARRAGIAPRPALPIPYLAVGALGLAAKIASRLFFRARARLPELLDPPRQRVRWRPLRYPNAHARAALNWTPRVSLAEGVAAIKSSTRDLPDRT
ncbi:NAD-dependent epimerase/dehydratase family protein [Sphingomonas sp. RS2018]